MRRPSALSPNPHGTTYTGRNLKRGSVTDIFEHIDSRFDTHLDRVRAYVRQLSISGEPQSQGMRRWPCWCATAFAR